MTDAISAGFERERRGEGIQPLSDVIPETDSMVITTKYRPQSDPNGIDQHEPGAKLDAGKERPALVLGGFSHALAAVTSVGTFGAAKYSDNGWREVENGPARYEDAMLRHWLALKGGERIDAESGLSHRAHLAWNALALIELEDSAL